MAIQFFTEVDRNKTTKKITSEYPGWYFVDREQFEDTERETTELKNQLEMEMIPKGERPYIKSQVERNEAILDKIKNSMPTLKDGDKDLVAKVYKQLGKEIGASMFTRTEMKKGLANPHDEANRMVKPCIEVNEKVAQMAEACGVRVRSGKISRNEASKIYKITGKYLGENTNVEMLRKDKRTVKTL